MCPWYPTATPPINRNSTSASTSSWRIAWISSSGTAAAAAGLGDLRHETRKLKDLFEALRGRQLLEFAT
jgi:hypothetical protein